MNPKRIEQALMEALREEGVIEVEAGYDENNPSTILLSGNLLPSRVAEHLYLILSSER